MKDKTENNMSGFVYCAVYHNDINDYSFGHFYLPATNHVKIKQSINSDKDIYEMVGTFEGFYFFERKYLDEVINECKIRISLEIDGMEYWASAWTE